MTTTITPTTLDLPTASHFAQLALGHIDREFPNKLDHVIGGAEDLVGPRALHPIFYGSFDWHSCVHGYWLLTQLYRRFPELPEASAIRDVVNAHFTPANVTAELAYLARPSSKTFERPYGWAWLLELAADLSLHTSPEGRLWHRALTPLATAFADRFLAHLPEATYPIRSGTHSSTAFALALALNYARTHDHLELERLLRVKALGWFSSDRDCQAWEPSGDDFLSPSLMEVECMRRVLATEDNPSAFDAWLAAFFPRFAERSPASIFAPAVVSNRSDGKIAHLDGLNLSRAWCLRGIAQNTGYAAHALKAAEDHLAASLPHVSGDYMGEHWLASFALLALTAA